MNQHCDVQYLGLMPYKEAWDLQNKMAIEIAAGERPPALLLLQHPHTYTFGRRGKIENLLWDDNELERRGLSVYWVDRGGDVTYHGPGQLVGYPLLPLAPEGFQINSKGSKESSSTTRLPGADYINYLRKLEEVIILALTRLGVVSGQLQGMTGVWVQTHLPSRCVNCPPGERNPPSKIAAIGVKVDVKGISRHGFALNVEPDMSYWEGIVGCGIKEYQVVSLVDILDPPPSMKEVMKQVVQAFGQVFEYKMEW